MSSPPMAQTGTASMAGPRFAPALNPAVNIRASRDPIEERKAIRKPTSKTTATVPNAQPRTLTTDLPVSETISTKRTWTFPACAANSRMSQHDAADRLHTNRAES